MSPRRTPRPRAILLSTTLRRAALRSTARLLGGDRRRSRDHFFARCAIAIFLSPTSRYLSHRTAIIQKAAIFTLRVKAASASTASSDMLRRAPISCENPGNPSLSQDHQFARCAIVIFRGGTSSGTSYLIRISQNQPSIQKAAICGLHVKAASLNTKFMGGFTDSFCGCSFNMRFLTNGSSDEKRRDEQSSSKNFLF